MEYRTPQHLCVVALEKGAFRSPATKAAYFILLMPLTEERRI